MEPKINVSFYLEGNEFSKEYIWEKLGLIPSHYRTKKDWPEAILDWPVYNPDLPDEYKPRTVWELMTGYDECMSVTDQLEKMIKRLVGKEDSVNQLCKELNLHITFLVDIKADAGYFPVINLDKEVVAFIAKIGADIIMDFGITEV